MSTKHASNKLPAFALLLGAAIILIGIAHIAVLPLFEGLDEAGHYSSLRQIETNGEMPMLGFSFIDKQAVDYRAHGPSSYDMPISLVPGAPQKEQIITYPTFFASAKLTAGYLQKYRSPSDRTEYSPVMDEFNWEAQHPPLYYSLLAPLAKATDTLSFTSQFFILRVASFLLAFTGLVIAMRASMQWAKDRQTKNCIAAAFMLYPVLVPMFFPEFGRIGNDSLCLFLFSLIWAITLDWLRDKETEGRNFLLGICFGFGLLTKALFIPLLGGFGILALSRLWIMRKKKPVITRIQNLVLVGGLALAIGGWWYLVQYAHTGTLTGSLDDALLQKKGGLFANLSGNFSFLTMIENIGWVIKSWSWYSTESFVSVQPLLHAPLLAFIAMILAGYLFAKKSAAKTLPLFYIIPLFAALIWHIVIWEALGQKDMTPGWYLSILAPALAMAMAFGIQRLYEKRSGRITTICLLAYSVVFLGIISWSQIALYGGCVTKGSDKLYAFPDNTYCFGRWDEVMSNLSLIGWPHAALALFICGFLCLVLGLYKMQQELTPQD